MHPDDRIVDHFATAKRSASAEMVAVMRAAHQSMDDRPLVHDDPLAAQIIGAEGRRWLDANQALMRAEYVRRIRGMLTIRSRLCEDELLRAVGRGTGQYVVLGAGLDTFAYRAPQLARRLKIFEVDQPATQAWKLERLREAEIAIPANLSFVSVDFNEGTLAGALASAGFERNQPAFFAWLGVSYYLPRASILEMMRFIAGQGAASEVVFDIALEESAIPAESLPVYRQLRSAMSTAAEPWQTWLEPEVFRSTLRDLGFTDVELLDAETLTRRFLAGRNDDLLPGPAMALVVARVGPPAISL